MAVMIGIDPHKGSHTAVALADNEEPLGQFRVRSAAGQVERLVQWATPFTERTWAIEGAGGLGYLLAQQLVAAGERVVDVQPKLAARVRLLATGSSNKNDPNDARSVAVAALRSRVPEVRAEDHVKVMKVWAKRHRDLSSHRTRIACRLHAVLCELTPGGFAGEISAAQATRLLDELEPAGAVTAARHAVACELVADLSRLDDQLRETKQRITAAVKASKTTLTGLFGVGPIVAATIIGDVADIGRFPAATTSPPTTAPPPIEVSSGERRRKVFRLSRRGNRRRWDGSSCFNVERGRESRWQGRIGERAGRLVTMRSCPRSCSPSSVTTVSGSSRPSPTRCPPTVATGSTVRWRSWPASSPASSSSPSPPTAPQA